MTIKKIIQLPRTLVNQLLHLAQQSPDQEVCGLIGRRVERCVCYPIDNAATDASVLFALNASEQIAAIKQMNDKGQELFAIYHSHPSSSALPSVTDLEDANYPDALYLIISLNTRGVLEMRGFYLRDQNVEEVNLSI
jgi:[CysO sulfur-carrier protein]-S-L-cysteine hydrolase